MKNFLRLLIIAGLITAGWLNREKLAGFGKGANVEEGAAAATPAAPAPPPPQETAAPPTPHPAPESKALAAQVYPALLVHDSAFSKKFRSLYAEALAHEPEQLAQPNWPIKFAERTAVALGGGVMPLPATPAPVKLQRLPGTALDRKPAH